MAEQAHRQHPHVVERDGGEVVGGQRLECRPAARCVTDVGVEAGQRGLHRRIEDLLRCRRAQLLLDFIGTPLEREEHDPLAQPGHPCVPRSRVASELVGPLDQRLHPGQPAAEECVHRRVRRHQPPLPGLAQFVGHPGGGGVFRLVLIQLGSLDELDQAADPRVDDLLGVAAPLRDLAQLVHDLPLFLERVGRPDGHLTAVECPGEHCWVTEPARDLHRLGGQGEPPRPARIALDPQRAGGEAGEHARPHLAVLWGQHSDGLLKQREQMRVASAPRPHEPSAVSERRLPQALGQFVVASDVRSPQERSLRGRVVSGARLHVAERQQQIAELGVVGAREALEILQSKAIEASGLLVGQASRR